MLDSLSLVHWKGGGSTMVQEELQGASLKCSWIIRALRGSRCQQQFAKCTIPQCSPTQFYMQGNFSSFLEQLEVLLCHCICTKVGLAITSISGSIRKAKLFLDINCFLCSRVAVSVLQGTLHSDHSKRFSRNGYIISPGCF